VGNAERDLFFFDLGSAALSLVGALTRWLGLPILTLSW
jgi:hypothetical protein